MQREIKFRAYFADIKAMVDFNLGEGYFKNIRCKEDEEMYDFELEDATAVMQYTGLKDRNGKEIYEGDLMKVNKPGMPIHRVEWNDSDHGWRIRVAPNGFMVHKINTQIFEVVGSIYETPELVPNEG
jgi:hypothetical protein